MACLCSNAEFKPEDLDKPVVEREVVGDATEQGILKCYESIEEYSEEIRFVKVTKFFLHSCILKVPSDS